MTAYVQNVLVQIIFKVNTRASQIKYRQIYHNYHETRNITKTSSLPDDKR